MVLCNDQDGWCTRTRTRTQRINLLHLRQPSLEQNRDNGCDHQLNYSFCRHGFTFRASRDHLPCKVYKQFRHSGMLHGGALTCDSGRINFGWQRV